MLRIEGMRETRITLNGQPTSVFDIQVSTAEELPAKDEVVGGAKIGAGSIAQIIQTGVFATLDEDGIWYANGEEI